MTPVALAPTPGAGRLTDRLADEYRQCLTDLDALEASWSRLDRGDAVAFASSAALAKQIAAKRDERDALARELERQRQIAEVAARLDAARTDIERDRRALLDRLLATADAPSEVDLTHLWQFDRSLDALVVALARARAESAPRPVDGLRDVCATLAGRLAQTERRAESVRHRRPRAESPAPWSHDLSLLMSLLHGTTTLE
jgi:hypothetical protein